MESIIHNTMYVICYYNPVACTQQKKIIKLRYKNMKFDYGGIHVKL